MGQSTPQNAKLVGFPLKTPEAVRTWLDDTETGRSFQEEIAGNALRRVPVLVVLHADGWVEVYGDRNLNLKMLTRPYCKERELAPLIDLWMDGQMHTTHRTLYVPSGPTLIGCGKCQRVTPEQLRESLITKGMLRELRA